MQNLFLASLVWLELKSAKQLADAQVVAKMMGQF